MLFRPFFGNVFKVAIVTDSADVATPGCNDIVPERKLAIPAIHHVAMVGFKAIAQAVFLIVMAAVTSRRNLDLYWDMAINVKVSV